MEINALANLLSDSQIAEQALAEDIIPSLTRVLVDGTQGGQGHATGALSRLLSHMSIDDALIERSNHCGMVLVLVTFLDSIGLEDVTSSNDLEFIAKLAGVKQVGGVGAPMWVVLVDFPNSLEPLVKCLAIGLPLLQEKEIETFSRLCRDQSIILGDLMVKMPRCTDAMENRLIYSSNLEVKVGGTALLICAAKEHKKTTRNALNESRLFGQLIHTLVHMMKYSVEMNGSIVPKFDEVQGCTS